MDRGSGRWVEGRRGCKGGSGRKTMFGRVDYGPDLSAIWSDTQKCSVS